MGDSLLLNDGTSFLVLNDGASKILLNSHQVGLKIRGRQDTPLIARVERLEIVSFKFKLISNLIPRAIIQLMNIKEILKPNELFAEKLRESFRFKVTDLKLRITKLAKTIYLEEAMKFMINENMDDILTGKALLKSFKEIYKKWKKQIK